MAGQINNQSKIQKIKEKIKHLFSGGIAGCFSRSVVAPIERIIILRQTGNKDYQSLSIIQCMQKMYKQDGIRGLFTGNGATCLRIAPFQAIEFFVFEYYRFYTKLILQRNNIQSFNEVQINLLTGALSGMTASTAVYPLDLVRTLLASQTNKTKHYNGIFKSIFQVYKEQGFLALYKGWGTTMCGIAPYASFKLSSFKFQQNLTKNNEFVQNNSVISNLIMGALSGCFAVTMTYPTDLLRKRMQIQVMQNQSNSLKHVIFSIHLEQGLQGFYRGLGATYIKVLPSTALAFATNEYLKKLLNVQGPNKQ